MPRTFPEIIDLEPHGTDVWVGATDDFPWPGRIYGGQVVAQGVRAALHTVDEAFRLHSVHAYFIRPGTTTEPVRYEVDRIRNGRSFCTRRVVARQSGGAILNLATSYQVTEDEPEAMVVAPPDDVPGPDDLPRDGWGGLIDRRTVDYPKGAGRASGWVRIVDPLPGGHGVAECGLAFTSDTLQFGAARSAHPEGEGTHGRDGLFMGASLDHALWFHRPVDPTRWHLYEVRSHGLVNGRGLVVGDVFDEAGTHVATMAQELLLRVRRDPS